jgi:hypothetical protein
MSVLRTPKGSGALLEPFVSLIHAAIVTSTYISVKPLRTALGHSPASRRQARDEPASTRGGPAALELLVYEG